MAAYTRKSLQQLDQADVYAPRTRDNQAGRGCRVSVIQVRSTSALFFSRIVLLEFSEATRDSSMANANFRRMSLCICYSCVDRMDPSDPHAILDS